MQLIGQAVKHVSWGKGIITSFDKSGHIVSVLFAAGEKQFLYPDAFTHYLTLKDHEIQNKVTSEYAQRLQVAKSRREVECQMLARRRRLTNMKPSENAQAAFQISVSHAQTIFANGTISTGCYLSGASKGKPRIPNRLKPYSCCLLTSVPAGMQEKDRLILGAIMVSETFWGEDCRDGLVKGHKKYRILLPLTLAISFWPYFENEQGTPHWGNIPFKYLSSHTMQVILHEILKILAGTEQETAAQAFYEYFCKINRLSAVPQISVT